MFIDDLPIANAEKDDLQRSLFLENVASLIINYADTNNNSLVIGIKDDGIVVDSDLIVFYEQIKNNMCHCNRVCSCIFLEKNFRF